MKRFIQNIGRTLRTGLVAASFMLASLVAASFMLASLAQAQVLTPQATNAFYLVSTNYNVLVSTNTVATIAPPGIGTQEFDIVLINFGTNRVHAATDGSTPSELNGEWLDPYYVSATAVNPGGRLRVTNRQSPIGLLSTNTLATATNRVYVQRRSWVPLRRYP